MLILPAGLLATGVVNGVDSGTVTSYYEGQAYVGDSPLVSEDLDDADVYLRGFRYSVDGKLRVEVSGTPVSFCEGLGLSASGQVCLGGDTIDTDDVGYLGGGLAAEEDGLVYAEAL